MFLLILVHQFPFRLTNANEPAAKTTTAPPETSKFPSQRSENEGRKRRNPATSSNKFSVLNALPAATPLIAAAPPILSTPSLPTADAIKMVPVTIFDFNGSPEYYDHISLFLDTHALHLVCVPTTEFHQAAPKVMEDVFNGKFDVTSSTIFSQLIQILQFLCDKASKTRAIMILPIATCIDLYETRPAEDR